MGSGAWGGGGGGGGGKAGKGRDRRGARRRGTVPWRARESAAPPQPAEPRHHGHGHAQRDPRPGVAPAVRYEGAEQSAGREEAQCNGPSPDTARTGRFHVRRGKRLGIGGAWDGRGGLRPGKGGGRRGHGACWGLEGGPAGGSQEALAGPAQQAPGTGPSAGAPRQGTVRKPPF